MATIPEKELKILEYWHEGQAFQKSVQKDAPKGEYVFYDGPPFATGLPHYGHIVASIMKDAIPRYWTMQGYRVERRWGWDCHGLPVENIAEKDLGFKDKRDIEAMGVDKFNDYCRSIVLKYAQEWRSTIERVGRWVDMEHDYKTMNPEYMETIWWVFKTLWDKGLVYKGYKSMHICPRCGTTLSNFEVTQNYKDIKDSSATLKFELVDEPGTFVLAWTTTPWTLVGNVALAVGADVTYIKARIKRISGDIKGKNIKEGETYIFSKELIAKVWDGDMGVLEGAEKVINLDSGAAIFFDEVLNIKGSELVGKAYKPLFDYYQGTELANKENGWKIYAANFVSTEDGTGVVHIAPAFGEDDMNLANEKKLPFIQHVDAAGRFKPEVTAWVGELVKPKDDVQAADKKVIDWLREKNLLFASDEYTHSYPHCWRCETPLLNYATESWFVEVTKIKDRMLKVNSEIHWYPDHLQHGRFGKWLEQARDWAISRNRYWGTPLPVWVCAGCDHTLVVGSRAELKELSGQEPADLHKQYIDPIAIPCAKCGGEMHRIPEVFDCWFESGSMPYAEVHYPFEQAEHIERRIPADFIAEGVDQTRGWFYTLIVLSTALFDRPMAKNVMVNGIVLAADGTKMSKSKKNYPDPMEVINKYGADALRFYLLSSPVMQAESLNFNENDVREVYNKVINTIHQVLNFYSLYRDPVLEQSPVESTHVLDTWVLHRLAETTQAITREMTSYDTVRSTRQLLDFVTDLSTWYIRRSRDRFKSDDGKNEALATTYQVLKGLAKISAPFIPFTAEYMWCELGVSEAESVHLSEWPKPEQADAELLRHMKVVMEVVEKAHAVRAAQNIKVRQPLPMLEITIELSDELRAIVADEVNVKEVVIVKTVSQGADIATDEARTIGLHTALTEELKEEGALRELVRMTNSLRKERGLKPSDTITVSFATTSDFIRERVIAKYLEQLKKQTISTDWQYAENAASGSEVSVNGEQITIGF